MLCGLYPVPLGTYYSLLRKITPHVFLTISATLGIGTFKLEYEYEIENENVHLKVSYITF